MEISSGQNELQDSNFSWTCLWIQSFSVAGVKKRSHWLQHQNFSMDFNKCSEEFPGVGWDQIEKSCGTWCVYTHWELLPTSSLCLYLSTEPQTQLWMSRSFTCSLTVLSIFLVLEKAYPFLLHPQTLVFSLVLPRQQELKWNSTTKLFFTKSNFFFPPAMPTGNLPALPALFVIPSCRGSRGSTRAHRKMLKSYKKSLTCHSGIIIIISGMIFLNILICLTT